MEKLMMEYMQKMNNLADDLKERDKTRDKQLQQVFKQLGVREQGNLPATTEPNPREQLRAITLRSGKELQGPEVEADIEEVPVDTSIGTTSQKKVKKSKDEKAFQKFLDVIGQVEVKMPLVDVLTEMPKYDASQASIPDCYACRLVGSGPIERFEMWGRHRSLTESVYLSSAVLTDYGYAEEMEQLLRGTRWHRLFTMRAKSSLPLTIEFLCSLELEPSTGSRSMNFQSIDSHTTLTFTLLGRGFQLTVVDLATHLGLYSWEETSAPEFDAAPYLLPADVDPANFWAGHSSDPDRFEGMGRARPLNTARVYPDDMIVFWSLHTRQEANVAVFVARFLYNQSMGNRTHIVCGFVVIILFRSLEGSAPIPQAQMLMRDLDAGMLRNAHIRRRLGASSTESNAASSSAPSTSGASSQVSSRRATRRRPTSQATPATTQADPTPEWARRILEQQDTIMQRMSEIGQQQHPRLRALLSFGGPLLAFTQMCTLGSPLALLRATIHPLLFLPLSDLHIIFL
ncbi:unnamed protein product [Cuscuta campestris]|uniref:Uncharacterized protein n=1 Tax=Cuscuta campestris TaxID=132261 RepID=A0A484M031_9ASTE|nr:unnamed protein product [Cuscuta campestris]